MKIRFQADADLRAPIVKGAQRREPTIDFQSANNAKLEGLDDLSVLQIAAAEGRVLVSHDVSTMPGNFALFLERSPELISPGVILIPQDLPYHRAIEGVIQLWLATEAKALQNLIIYLPR